VVEDVALHSLLQLISKVQCDGGVHSSVHQTKTEGGNAFSFKSKHSIESDQSHGKPVPVGSTDHAIPLWEGFELAVSDADFVAKGRELLPKVFAQRQLQVDQVDLEVLGYQANSCEQQIVYFLIIRHEK